EEKQEHHFQDHLGRHGLVTVPAVAARHLPAHKRKVDDCFYLAQWMISSHPLLQIHRIIKELRLALLLSHHDGNTALPHHRQLGYYFLLKTSHLGNTPLRFDPKTPISALQAQRGYRSIYEAPPCYCSSGGSRSHSESAHIKPDS